MQVSLDHLEQEHDLSSTLSNLSQIPNKDCVLDVKIRKEKWIIPFLLDVTYQLFLITVSDFHELAIESIGV